MSVQKALQDSESPRRLLGLGQRTTPDRVVYVHREPENTATPCREKTFLRILRRCLTQLWPAVPHSELETTFAVRGLVADAAHDTLVVNMSRSPEILELLGGARGMHVVNSPSSVACCLDKLALFRVLEGRVDCPATYPASAYAQLSADSAHHILKPRRHCSRRSPSVVRPVGPVLAVHDPSDWILQRLVLDRHPVKAYYVAEGAQGRVLLRDPQGRCCSHEHSDRVTQATRRIHNITGLEVFNAEFLTDDGIPYVIDVNEFPSGNLDGEYIETVVSYLQSKTRTER